MLKTIYDNEADIPEGYAALYTERNGKWELTGVTGVKTQADIDRVQSALVKERGDHKTLKDLYRPFEGLDPEVLLAQETELEETKAQLAAIKADGTIDETKLEPIIAARVAQKVAPIERDKLALQRKLDDQGKVIVEREGEVLTLKSSITTGDITRQISDAAVEAKLLPTAISDAVRYGREVFEKTEDGRVITKDASGTTPGLSPKEWFKDQMDKTPHWWPASVGGNATGGGKGGAPSRANNPWSKGSWNITKQGVLIRELGEEKAGQIAAQVGSHIGATKPSAD